MHKNSRGIAAILPIILALIILGLVGYIVYNNFQSNTESGLPIPISLKSKATVSPLPTTPTPTTVGKQTPAPVEIESISYSPISTWQDYSDNVAGFSIQYPETYKLGNTDTGRYVKFLDCFDYVDKGEICLSGYTITVYDDYEGGSRRVWFEGKRPNFLINPFYESVTVAGKNTLIIMDGNLGGSTGSFVLIPKGNEMYLFEFPYGYNPETKEKDGLNTIKQVLATFRLVD